MKSKQIKLYVLIKKLLLVDIKVTHSFFIALV